MDLLFTQLALLVGAVVLHASICGHNAFHSLIYRLVCLESWAAFQSLLFAAIGIANSFLFIQNEKCKEYERIKNT